MHVDASLVPWVRSLVLALACLMHVEGTYSALFAFSHQNDPHTCLVRVCIGVRVLLSQLIVVAI